MGPEVFPTCLDWKNPWHDVASVSMQALFPMIKSSQPTGTTFPRSADSKIDNRDRMPTILNSCFYYTTYRPYTYDVISPWLVIVDDVETRESVAGLRSRCCYNELMTVRAHRRRIVSLLPDQDLAKKCAGFLSFGNEFHVLMVLQALAHFRRLQTSLASGWTARPRVCPETNSA